MLHRVFWLCSGGTVLETEQACGSSLATGESLRCNASTERLPPKCGFESLQDSNRRLMRRLSPLLWRPVLTRLIFLNSEMNASQNWVSLSGGPYSRDDGLFLVYIPVPRFGKLP